MSTTGAVVVAAGRGDRFGGPKQFLVLDGERLVDRAVAICRRHCDEVVVVLPPGTPWRGPAVDAAVAGGATRSASVRAGLAALSDSVAVVVVHDAARPLADDDVFTRVLAAVRDGADAAVPGVPIADTVKRIVGDRVVETVDRSDLVAVQTPQAFRASALRAAHVGAGDATDDAGLVERTGGRVVVVAGSTTNLKITTPADLAVAVDLVGEGPP